ncbi:restriction endonuclease subunit S [Trichormus sp. NMC-1]|uniref:restriction endonuclease subunit S n=1 Tax=Trichormus sp. NMC-1 TaxID=1853259 RepID=UPI0008DBFE24|nr:restriction endonuclease subunit S [Trichormus sp. NMC-1]
MEVNLSRIHTAPLGTLPIGWNLVKLKEITIKIGSGATPRGGDRVYLLNRKNFAFIRSQNVFNRYFNSEGLVFISDEHATELQKVSVLPGDLLLNITGDGVTFSRACIVPEEILPACVNQHVSIIRPNPKICDSGYLLSYLTHPLIKTYIESFNSGGSRRSITKGHIESFLISIPPLSEQKAIAHILGTLDDKIELNRQMNEILEAMARAIFKSWFVDFDPVRAKMEGRQPAGMDAATAALFPDEFEETSLGLIPKGWRVETLGEEIEIIKGKSYKSSELVPSSTALVTLKSFHRGGGYRPDGLKPYNGTYKPEQIIKPGELVVAYTDVTQAADVIGKPAIVKPDERYNTLVASLDLGIIRVRNKNLNIPFLYYLFNQNDFQNHVYSHTNGSTVLHLSKDGIPSYEFCLPHSSLISKFEKFISPIFEKSNINWQESIDITALRDTLLPKLMSGKIRVKEAEKLLEKVA